MGVSTISNAYATVRSEVLDGLEQAKLDPARDVEKVRELVDEAVAHYQRRAHANGGATLRDPRETSARVLRAVTAYGALTELFARRDVEEVFIEGDRVLYLDGDGRLRGLTEPTTEVENRQIVEQLLATTERHLDVRSPMVQGRVLSGTARLTAAIPPVADRLSATIRKYTLRRETLAYLVERDSLTAAAAGFLWATMQARTSTIVSGQPGAGKTSLLSALLAAAPPHHCVRSCEEIRELSAPIAHGAYYESRPPSLDGGGQVSLRDLVKFVLAMRPDLLVVGEVRGAEAFELTRAANAGTGFLATVHANSARDALSALVNAAIMAGENVGEALVRSVFGSTIHFVVHLDRDEAARLDVDQQLRRQVLEIIALVPGLGDGFSTEPIFARDGLGRPLSWTGVLPPNAELIDRALPAGLDLRSICEGRSVPL